MLEKMGAFFDARLADYDSHMLRDIEGAEEFYPFTAAQLPAHDGAAVLDLGCGTGLELEFYYRLNPTARVTGIDLAPGMLGALRNKFPGRDLELILGSYFDVPFGNARFDAVVSVESLHHFTQAEKIPLYAKCHRALKTGGCLILTDYFAETDEQEADLRQALIRLKAEEGIGDGEFYHYDTPLTWAHEIQALEAAGFSRVKIMRNWGATYTMKAYK